MSFLFSYSQYLDNNASNYTTETMSEDTIFLNDDNCTCHQTSCAKLIADEVLYKVLYAKIFQIYGTHYV